MRIAAVQSDLSWEDAPSNRRRLAGRVAEAAADGAQLVLLAEMFPTGFSMSTERVAEAPDGASAEFLATQAREESVWVAGSFACRVAEGAKPTNRFLAAGPGGELVAYDKVHPFSYGGEADAYAAGSTRSGFCVDGVRLTPFVCYDLRFADWFWQAASDTDCYVVVANWPAARQSHWTALLRARAIENQAYAVGVNRVGEGGGVRYVGGSVAFSPLGETLAEAGDEETTLLAEVDAAEVARLRARYPFLADR